MSLIRRFREPLPFFPSFSLSSFFSLLKTISGQSCCNPIDPTGHIRAVTAMLHRGRLKLSS
jgi:hypothetical protein